ncbi:MAG: iron ABC transporter permease [Kiritimatiellia bacterium]|nr:iron ABC transporter permease [Kiritimatiellia bacterium]MDP6630138.1 iron ABC transporter permease [Kiritimatiellia bacterium]MDP6810639.1 iron ABC transporter permease [Kiritimatiellia bacterium]MDP7023724.1 iron ABC transporter permease [Kiritimatiellia bacterium]
MICEPKVPCGSSRWPIVLLALAGVLLLVLCALSGPSGFGLPAIGTPVGRAILSLRLHRIVTGLVVGAALSCAGVVFQALLRNPLAEPYILGVSSGAGLGAAAAILTGLGGAVTALLLPTTAFAGAMLALLTVLAVAGGTRASVYSLILSGVIVSAIASSILMFLVATAPREGLHSVIWWMLGNLQPASQVQMLVTTVVVVGGIVAAWLIAPQLDALTLGREVAHHVGVRTELLTAIGLVLGSLLAAAAVSLAGLIGFVGLIVPHVMRSLLGPGHRRLIPATALAGGVFLALCDALARSVLAPREIPVGVLTALCGGPFFLAILKLRGRKGWVE